ncbi:MAG: anti-sigma factor family protein [Alphaproteobacteria bacterium]
MNRHLPMMITCAQMDALMVDYLDGNLQPRERRRFNIHVRLCKDCHCFLRAYRTTVTLSKSAFRGSGHQALPPISPDPSVH